MKRLDHADVGNGQIFNEAVLFVVFLWISENMNARNEFEGFDAHTEDDMAMLRFTDGDYGWVTAQVKSATDRHTGGRIVSLLEGGYALSALGRSAVQHVRVLAGLDS